MCKIANRLVLILAFLLVGSSLKNCEKQPSEELLFDDLELHNLLILPNNPNSSDQILVVETICGNESDVILTFQGNQIKYQRYYNSLMMMPCSPTLDTTIIGQLNAGTYQFVHCMIDKNHLISDSIFLLDTIPLVVK